MAYVRFRVANFHAALAGLSTVGFTQYNADGSTAATRSTTGVFALGGGSYGAPVTSADGFTGAIVFDTGGTSPAYYAVPVNDPTERIAEATDAVLSDEHGEDTWEPYARRILATP